VIGRPISTSGPDFGFFAKIRNDWHLAASARLPASAALRTKFASLLKCNAQECQKRRKSMRTEALAGLTTFFTMSYIVIVNP
jgi:hypothetical protein